MDPLLVLMGIALVAGTVFVALQYRRRAAPPIADDPRDAWELPEANASSRPSASASSSSSSSPSGGQASASAVPQFLDRDMLLNPERTLNPAAWDTVPADPEPTPAKADEPPARPMYFDRSLLEKGTAGGE